MKRKLQIVTMTIAVLVGTAGLASAQGYGDYHYGNGYYDRDDTHEGIRVARDFGSHDGASVAREDMWKGKPFNPNPRGRFGGADDGYRHEFGSKHDYREIYSQAYRESYENTFRDRRSYR